MPSRVVSEEPLRSVSQLVTHTAALSESTQVGPPMASRPSERIDAGRLRHGPLPRLAPGRPPERLQPVAAQYRHAYGARSDSSYFNADSGASIASFLTEYLPDELSSDADVLLSLSEPAVSGGQLTLSPQSFVVFG